MLTKKDFKQLADMCADIDEDIVRSTISVFLENFCRDNNPRFDASRFHEWIRRVRAKEDLKGLR